MKFFMTMFMLCSSAIAVAQGKTTGGPNTNQLGQLPVSGLLFYNPQTNAWMQYEQDEVTGRFKTVAISGGMAEEIAKSSFEFAKVAYCKLPVAPQSISVSAGVVSATWSKEQICGSDNK